MALETTTETEAACGDLKWIPAISIRYNITVRPNQ